MSRVLQSVPANLVPYPAIIVLGIALTVVYAILGVTNYVVRDWTLSWEGSCMVTEWNKDGAIGFKVTCGDQGETSVTDWDVVRSYMDDPGPLVCRRYLTDSITCSARPKVEEEDKT